VSKALRSPLEHPSASARVVPRAVRETAVQETTTIAAGVVAVPQVVVAAVVADLAAVRVDQATQFGTQERPGCNVRAFLALTVLAARVPPNAT